MEYGIIIKWKRLLPNVNVAPVYLNGPIDIEGYTYTSASRPPGQRMKTCKNSNVRLSLSFACLLTAQPQRPPRSEIVLPDKTGLIASEANKTIWALLYESNLVSFSFDDLSHGIFTPRHRGGKLLFNSRSRRSY